MMFKHHIGDVPKSISDLFQTNSNYHSYNARSSQSLRSHWKYISGKITIDVSDICFKNIVKLHNYTVE